MSFVTRTGSTLIDPDTKQPLRFVSFNTPSLTLNDDPTMQVPTPWEQEDLLESISEMGGRVVRSYVLSVQNSKETASTAVKHIVKKGNVIGLQESVMKGFDSALSLAQKRGIKVIIPLIDRWEWWGGVMSFTGLVDQTLHNSPNDFFTNRPVIDAFKSVVGQLLNRNNTVTGVLYKNDPTILAFETGNELENNGAQVPSSWTSEIAAYIKSQDANHLVMDGSFTKNGVQSWAPEILQNSNIDIYSNHYYRHLSLSTVECIGIALLGCLALSALLLAFITWCFPRRVSWIKVPPYSTGVGRRAKRRQCITVFITLILIAAGVGGIVAVILHRIPNPYYGALSASDAGRVAAANKVFISGEFGLASVASMQDVMSNVVSGVPAFAGALVWSLRGHSTKGGFYTHPEMQGYDSYHYPGFPSAQGFGGDEIAIVQAVRSAASKVATLTGFAVPPAAAPTGKPVFLNATSTALRWQGVTGATGYDLYRTDQSPTSSDLANWTYLAKNVKDNVDQKSSSPIFTDASAKAGTTYSYLVLARNDVGTGPSSDIVVLTA
ncbi:hypothetical protein HKX48_006166 [Thoreauomyces humboldtii]|nr:hypothetical protein HKX48_006166 [Thoreauomyces humboldtii]